MALCRILVSLVIALTVSGAAQSQTLSLSEGPLVGSYHDVKLSLSLSGSLKLRQDGKEIVFKESATATHDYAERLLEAGPEGTAVKSAHYYKTARVSLVVDANKMENTLDPAHHFLVAQRGRDGVQVYCPQGAMTREELDVADHFDTLAVSGVLPSKDVSVGESWKLGNGAVQALCHLQALSENTVAAKLDQVRDGIAVFTVTGTATGIDLGATVSSTVKATCRFDTGKKRLIAVDWNQKDEREAGPVSPASSLELAVKLSRTPIDPVNELSDAALVPVPEGPAPGR